jgi:SAM-dependent methyltransferase
MSSVLTQLAGLAEAACRHARERHQTLLRPGNWDQVDVILDREREQPVPEEQEALALCYGAWTGQELIQSFSAEWTGLHEPVPPRIRIRGVCYSPVDAIRRRLITSAAPPLRELVRNISRSPAEEDSLEANRTAWNHRAGDQKFASVDLAIPETREQALEALDPWLANVPLTGCSLLCLAAAGGTHGPLFAKAGAKVTVVDFSPALLAMDEEAARRYQLDLKTLCADMRDLSLLPDRQFDLVVQPVSTCYIPDLMPMYREIFRVLKPEGLYFSQHKSPASLQSGRWNSATQAYPLIHPVADGFPLPPASAVPLPQRETDMQEYLHSLSALLGGMCRSGLVIEAIEEPERADAWAPAESAEHRALYLPPYLKVLARRG